MSNRLLLVLCTALSTLSTLGCEDPATRLAVSVRTDFQPGGEFDAIHVEFAGTSLEHAARSGGDYVEGVRLAEEPAELGETGIVVQLMRGGDVVIERRVSVVVRAPLTIATLVITRDCTGVMCPGSGSPLFESCLGGQCADPRCTRETPEFCPAAECTNDAACPDGDCVVGRCVEGVCFAAPDNGMCGDGFECDAQRGCLAVSRLMDAGVDAHDASASCLDGAQNGAESGVDCGGPCPPCNACPSMPNALFCSDFSDLSLRDWDRTQIGGGSQLQVSGEGAREGSSLLLSAEASAGTYVERTLPAALTGPLYARFYLYVEPGALDAERTVFELASASSTLRFVVNASDSGFGVYTNGESNGGGPPGRQGQWQCVRYEVQIGAEGEHSFAVDNQSTEFPPLDTRPGASGYNRVRLGLLAAEGTVAANMRIDDFAIGTSPIPCL